MGNFLFISKIRFVMPCNGMLHLEAQETSD